MTRARPAHLAPRRPAKRLRMLAAVLGATVSICVLGTGAAFAYWNLNQNTNSAEAVANSLPQGAPPSAAVSPAGSNTVKVSFAEVTTTSGYVPIVASDYMIKRYPAGGTASVVEAASCSGSGTITCVLDDVTDGTWQFTDTPTYALNWVGIESAKSPTVVISTPPTVTITYPVNGAAYGSNWAGAISGTAASSAGAGTSIFSVAVAVEDTTTGKWWNGISFASGTQVFATASGTTGWTLVLPLTALTCGDSYSVVAQATDSLGNTALSPKVDFSYNKKATTPPCVTITYPRNNVSYGTNWAGAVTGTASSNAGSGTSIFSVAVSVENMTTGEWWNGTAFGSSSQLFVTATGTTGWTLALPASALTGGDSYAAVAQATDSLGNTATSATVDFNYLVQSSSAPTVTITYPVNGASYGSNWAGVISGTAAANAGPGTSVTSVAVAVEDDKTGKWWNGTAFGASSQNFVTAAGTTSWTLPLSVQALTSCTGYSIVAKATDSLGDTAESTTVDFTYNPSKPVVTIGYPLPGAWYDANSASWSGAVTGTSSDSGGTVAAVAVSVQLGSGFKSCWTGTGSNFTATCPNYLPAGGTANWSFALPSSALTSGDSYQVSVEATDTVGETGTGLPVSFTFDTADPTISHIRPAVMGDCGGQCATGIYWTITGSNLVTGATVSFPGTGPDTDFSVVGGSTSVSGGNTILLEVKDTKAAPGTAQVSVTDPGETAAVGTVQATGSGGITSIAMMNPSNVAQGQLTTLNLSLTGTGCSAWGSLTAYFSDPGISAGEPVCSRSSAFYEVSIPVSVSANALLGDSSVTLATAANASAASVDGLVVVPFSELPFTPSISLDPGGTVGPRTTGAGRVDVPARGDRAGAASPKGRQARSRGA